MGIRHSVSKTKGEIGLASEWNADHVVTDDVDVAKHQLLSAAIENRTDWPAGPVTGQVIYRTDLGMLYVWSGSDWVAPGGKWEIIGEDVLTTFRVVDFTNIPTKYLALKIIGTATPLTGAASELSLCFNNDAGPAGPKNYRTMYSSNGGALTASSGYALLLMGDADWEGASLEVLITNDASIIKHVTGTLITRSPEAVIHGFGYWNNTTGKITTIQVSNNGLELDVGTHLILLGLAP